MEFCCKSPTYCDCCSHRWFLVEAHELSGLSAIIHIFCIGGFLYLQCSIFWILMYLFKLNRSPIYWYFRSWVLLEKFDIWMRPMLDGNWWWVSSAAMPLYLVHFELLLGALPIALGKFVGHNVMYRAVTKAYMM